MKHARNSASGAKRWIACPGSIKLSEQCPPPKESPYALEGTFAHEHAETLLREFYEQGWDHKVHISDNDMYEAVQVYFETVKEAISYHEHKNKTKFLKIEEKFSLEWLHPGMFGTNDACIYDPDKEKLTIIDYKHGKGVVVNPEWNPQLMFYALGAMYSFKDVIDTVELVVVQPRASHVDGPIRRWTISGKDLWFWGTNILAPAARETEKENAPLRSGEHCRFCPALAICPQQIKDACAIAKTDFERPVLPCPSSLTPSDIEKVMEVSELINAWVKEVKEYAQNQVEVGCMKLDNFKLVQRRANRKWIDEDIAIKSLEMQLGERAYIKKPISIAQAEKILKKSGANPDIVLEGLWAKPDNGITLAHVTDRRKEVASTARLDFIDQLDFLQ